MSNLNVFIFRSNLFSVMKFSHDPEFSNWHDQIFWMAFSLPPKHVCVISIKMSNFMIMFGTRVLRFHILYTYILIDVNNFVLHEHFK